MGWNNRIDLLGCISERETESYTESTPSASSMIPVPLHVNSWCWEWSSCAANAFENRRKAIFLCLRTLWALPIENMWIWLAFIDHQVLCHKTALASCWVTTASQWSLTTNVESSWTRKMEIRNLPHSRPLKYHRNWSNRTNAVASNSKAFFKQTMSFTTLSSQLLCFW